MAVDIELAHQIDEQTPHSRRLAALVGIAAVLASLLGVLQMHSGGHEGRNGARAARLSSEIARGVAVQGLVSSFHLPTLQMVLAEGITAHSRALQALEADLGANAALAVAEAEDATVERLSALIEEMAATPEADSGVDPATLETLSRDLGELNALTEEQNAAVDEAQRYGRRGDRSVLALSIAAVAAVLLGLGGIVGPGRGGTLVLWAASAALLVAALTGASALLI